MSQFYPVYDYKQALIEIDRTHGPLILDSIGIDPSEKIDLLIHTLPPGTPQATSFMVTPFKQDVFVTLMEKKESTIHAYLIGFPKYEVIPNPFRFFSFMKNQINKFTIADTFPIEKEQNQGTLKINNLSYAIGSLLLEQKLILVGDLKNAIDFFTHFFDNFHYSQFDWLKCEFPANSLYSSSNIVLIQDLENHKNELKELLFESSIILLSKRQCYGFYSSSFTNRLAWLFEQKDSETISNEIMQFNKLINLTLIDNPAEFANTFSITKKDAKLFQQIQKKKLRL